MAQSVFHKIILATVWRVHRRGTRTEVRGPVRLPWSQAYVVGMKLGSIWEEESGVAEGLALGERE